MSREDINYYVVHLMMFLVAYVSAMVSLHNTAIFDWSAMQAGLVATMGTNVGYKYGAPSNNHNNGDKVNA